MNQGIAQDILTCIPASHAAVTAKCLRNTFGPDGFILWRNWLQNQREQVDMAAWPETAPQAFNARLLEDVGKQSGYASFRDMTRPRVRRNVDKELHDNMIKGKEAIRIGAVAETMLKRASFQAHPYLASKGFINEERPYGPPGLEGSGLVDSAGHLLIPMRHVAHGWFLALQRITQDGDKRYWPTGCTTREAVHKIGEQRRPVAYWLVEGYATGLSVRKALLTQYRRRDQVVVCFSANNLVTVSAWASVGDKVAVVVADNDKSGVGEVAAWKTGLPFWMPPVVGMDANDYEMAYGAEVLGEELEAMLA